MRMSRRRSESLISLADNATCLPRIRRTSPLSVVVNSS
jgi:hypothetical protein